MSLLSTFIQNNVLKALEAEFLAHAPEMQAVLVDEVSAFANQVLAWAEGKLSQPQPKE